MLDNKTVLLGVGGGPLTWVAVEVLRELQRAGARVRVAFGAEADAFVPTLTFQTLSGEGVISANSLYGEIAAGEFRSLATVVRETDAILVVPATPALLAKAATGCVDEAIVRALVLNRGIAMMAFPGQAAEYQHPLVQQNIQRLREAGIYLYEDATPEFETAEDILEWTLAPEDIVTALGDCIQETTVLSGKMVVITAGPTQEPIDPVRHISNRSSGKTGFVLAAAARRRGARVVLISGPTHLQPPAGVKCVRVRTALEMRQAVLDHFDQADAVIKTAAVSDFRPRQVAPGKVKKEAADLSIPLERNPDILAELGRQKGKRILVGFAAESDDLLQYAQQKVKSKNLDLIVANDISDPEMGFASDDNRVCLLDAAGHVEELPRMSKSRIAEHILDRIQSLFGSRDETQ